MLELYYTNKFKKDYRLLQKRGYDTNLVDDVLRKLARREVLPEKFCDHKLGGEYKRI